MPSTAVDGTTPGPGLLAGRCGKCHPEPGRSAAPFVTVHLRSPTLEVRLFTMLTSIGTPLDVTAEELHVETYFPADDASEQILRAL